MTQLESARKGVTTPEMIRVAVRENVTRLFVRDRLRQGRVRGQEGADDHA
jgi:thiamine biosynthesis protein ThiC